MFGLKRETWAYQLYRLSLEKRICQTYFKLSCQRQNFPHQSLMMTQKERTISSNPNSKSLKLAKNKISSLKNVFKSSKMKSRRTHNHNSHLRKSTTIWSYKRSKSSNKTMWLIKSWLRLNSKIIYRTQKSSRWRISRSTQSIAWTITRPFRVCRRMF